ncbi:endolytic transglycosylase MltG [Nitrogeniibacter aestuarii]|uniref:endolytic transglycosylase MltG n=1 Tax=Nitrogeniibacter aestuarii TaxID=2815343 RepID=UPI001D1077EA|nr:endolytic transglycosylase MltG [Nitrogeniibacter aestuarii]
MKIRFLIVLLIVPILLVAGAALWAINKADSGLEVNQGVTEVTVPKGASMRDVAQLVADAGVDIDPRFFYWMARLSGQAHQIKAGSYEVRSGISPRGLLDKLVSGDVILRSVALIEGWTFRQVRQALQQNEDLTHEIAELTDAEILKRIGAEESHPEGLFFPDTYSFHRGDSEIDVLKRAYEQMQTHLAEQWAGRDTSLPLKSPYEALILASIVEKETGQAEDRPMIASVFINRLRVGMLLQTDPTVIYGIGERFDGNLRRNDLTRDTPYNTYTRNGLPPTPIAMPGLASLRAALNPPESKYYYFVARGDGSSEFSRSLAEHNRAVRKFQLKR